VKNRDSTNYRQVSVSANACFRQLTRAVVVVAPKFERHGRLIYSARLLVLAVITVSGIMFLMWSGLLLWLLHEMPGIITRENILTTVVFGSVSAFFGVLYVFLVRKTDKSN